jgi:hypothetical protein
MLPVTLIDESREPLAKTLALIDSGADVTTFSHSWADLMGIDFASCTPVDVGGSAHYVYTDGFEVEVLGERLVLPLVFFSMNLPIAYLSRVDFFEHYLVLFDQRSGEFHLERRVSREEEAATAVKLPDPSAEEVA